MYRVKCAHSYTLCDGLTNSAGICVLESVNSLVPEHFQLFLPVVHSIFRASIRQEAMGRLSKRSAKGRERLQKSKERATRMKLELKNSELVHFRLSIRSSNFTNSAKKYKSIVYSPSQICTSLLAHGSEKHKFQLSFEYTSKPRSG